ncbi:MAG: hypothetical protein ACJ72N_07200 [Labedaea sp.]
MRAAGVTLTVVLVGLAVATVVLLNTDLRSRVPGQPVGLDSQESDRTLVADYFNELNDAGRDGPGTQRDFLRRTQHPDFTAQQCDLGDLTLKVDPAMSTFRMDPRWTPTDSTKHPRGLVYVLGVSISIRRDGTPIAEQIGSERVVVLDGKAYGFAPCPTR